MKTDCLGSMAFIECYSDEVLDAMMPERLYPRWEKRYSGYHYELSECSCESWNFELVPDEDAVEYDVWVPYLPTLFSLIPKQPLKDIDWNVR